MAIESRPASECLRRKFSSAKVPPCSESPPVPSPRVKSPPCSMKPGMMRCSRLPLKCNGRPLRSLPPLTNPTKLATVAGVTWSGSRLRVVRLRARLKGGVRSRRRHLAEQPKADAARRLSADRHIEPCGLRDARHVGEAELEQAHLVHRLRTLVAHQLCPLHLLRQHPLARSLLFVPVKQARQYLLVRHRHGRDERSRRPDQASNAPRVPPAAAFGMHRANRARKLNGWC